MPTALGYVRKFSGAIVVKEMHAIVKANGEIGLAVVVKIARRATEPAALNCQTRSSCFVFEFSVARVVQKPQRPAFGCTHQKQIRLAVAVVIEKTCAGAWPSSNRLRGIRVTGIAAGAFSKPFFGYSASENFPWSP